MEPSLSRAGRKASMREDSNGLFGNLARLSPNFMGPTMINSYVPLGFERLPGGTPSPEYEADYNRCNMFGPPMIYSPSPMSETYENFSSREAWDAYQKAKDALCCMDPAEAIALAEQALAISPYCAEAYNVLAVHKAQSYEEALDFYKQGAELGPKMYSDSAWQEALEDHSMHSNMPLRGVLRSAYGVANTLRKMKRGKEAYDAWQVLFTYDPEWRMFSTYTNLYAHYPEVVIRARGHKACMDWMHRWQHSEGHITYNSSGHIWTASYALCHYATRKDNSFTVRMAEDDDVSLGAFSRGAAMWHLVTALPDLVDLLLGDRPMPSGRFSEQIPGSSSFMAAVVYVASNRDLWEEVPGALQHLRRYRNTVEVRCLGYDLRRGHAFDMAEYRRFLDDGIYADGVMVQASGEVVTLLDDFVAYARKPDPEFTQAELQVLEALLQAGCPLGLPASAKGRRIMETPLSLSTYRSYGPAVTQLLLKYGANGGEANRGGMQPLEMGANQGSWREMHVLLSAQPQLLTTLGPAKGRRLPADGGYTPESYLELLLLSALNSSCAGCLDHSSPWGGCQRCHPDMGGSPHNPRACFYRTLDVLLVHGLQATPRLLRHIGKSVSWQAGAKLVAYLQQAAARGVSKEQVDALAGFKGPEAQQQVEEELPVPAPSEAAAAGHGHSCGPGCGHSHQQQQQQVVHHHCGPSCSHDHHDHSHAHPRPSSAAAAASSSSSSSSSAQQRLDAALARPRACWKCGGGDKLKRCTGCQVALYCSRECQTRHWKVHKKECGEWKQAQGV